MSNYTEESTLGGHAPIGRLAPAAGRGDAATGGAWGRLRGRLAVRPARTARPRVGRWEWPILGAILAAAAALNFYGLAAEGYANSYYAATVRSMLESWRNFFFASFDPGGFVTVDKPPLGFWVQAISAKVFGFRGWSLLLPQALAGVLSAALLWWLVRRAWGPLAGLIAALALAVTPISVVTNRNNTIDSLLVLCVLGATWATVRAIESPHHPLRWLLLAAALVGLGFNIKMLEAYLVLPALWLAYLLIARPRWYARIGHLALATVVLLAVSFSWATAVDLTPESQRPYVGSSQTNSVYELALGYNGLQRLFGNVFGRRGGGLSEVSVNTLFENTSGGGVGGANENGTKGLFRLLNAQLGGQIGWLVPLAVAGLLGGAWVARPRHRRFWRFAADPRGAGVLRRRRASVVIWGTWFATMAAFFSIAGFYHRYYLTMLAPGVAALVGLGAAALWLAWRARGWGGLVGLALPAALVGTALVQRRIFADYPTWSARLVAPVLALAALAAAVLVVAWPLRRRLGRWATRPAQAALVVGLAALLIAPSFWSGISVQAASDGMSSNLPAAGPASARGMGAPGGFAPGGATQGRTAPNGADPRQPGATGNQRGAQTGGQPAIPGAQGGALPDFPPDFPGAHGGIPQGGFPQGDGMQQGFGGGQLGGAMLQWLVANRGNARFIVAVSSSMQASGTIIETGLPIMATGGFSGNDPILTAESLQQRITNGTIRYFLAGGGMGGPGGGAAGFSVNSWVAQHCAAVPASAWGGSGTSQLYDCAPAR